MNVTRCSWRTAVLAAALAAVASLSDVAARAGDAPRAIAAIENDLVTDDPAVRAKAAAELTDRFPDGAVAVPMLVDLLDDESPVVVAAAAKAIDAMAVAGAEPLTAYLADDAHWKGTRLDKPLAEMLSRSPPTALGGVDWDRVVQQKQLTIPTDEAVVVALLRTPTERLPDVDVAQPLVTAFGGASDDQRRSIAAALAMNGADRLAMTAFAPAANPRRSAAAAAGVELLKSDHDARAWAGARVLQRLRCSEPAVMSALIVALSAKKPPVESSSASERLHTPEAACEALGALGPDAAAAAPVLLEWTAKEKPSIVLVQRAVAALARIGKESEVAGSIGRDETTTLLIMLALAKDRRAAGVVVPYLVEHLRSNNAFADHLARYGPAAAAALPALEQCALTCKLRSAHYILGAILSVAPNDPLGPKWSAELLQSDDDAIRTSVLEAIARHAPYRPEFATALLPTLAWAADGKSLEDLERESMLEFVLETADAMGRFGAAGKPAVPHLVQLAALTDGACTRLSGGGRASAARRRVACALGRIGPDAAAAVRALTALRDKGDETIRVPAAQAVRRIKATK